MTQTNVDLSPELIAEALSKVIQKLSQKKEAGSAPASVAAGKLNASSDYPLAEKRPDLVRSASGLSLEEITLDKVVSKNLKFEDVKIKPETLEYQAQIAESVGRPRLAGNLRRAAELTRIPDARVLEMYNMLRPYRCTKQELTDLARELEGQYQAKICAAFVREAADVYEKRNRLKK